MDAKSRAMHIIWRKSHGNFRVAAHEAGVILEREYKAVLLFTMLDISYYIFRPHHKAPPYSYYSTYKSHVAIAFASQRRE